MSGGTTGAWAVAEMDFRYFNRTAWHEANRPQDITPFVETATLELSPLDANTGHRSSSLPEPGWPKTV